MASGATQRLLTASRTSWGVGATAADPACPQAPGTVTSQKHVGFFWAPLRVHQTPRACEDGVRLLTNYRLSDSGSRENFQDGQGLLGH